MQEDRTLHLRPGERVRAILTSRTFMFVVLGLLIASFIIAAQAKGVSANALLSLFVRGTLLGGTLALGAIGVTLVFAVLKMANFAHGDTMTFGAYIGLLVIMLLPKGRRWHPSRSVTSSSWRYSSWCRSSGSSRSASIRRCSAPYVTGARSPSCSPWRRWASRSVCAAWCTSSGAPTSPSTTWAVHGPRWSSSPACECGPTSSSSWGWPSCSSWRLPC